MAEALDFACIEITSSSDSESDDEDSLVDCYDSSLVQTCDQIDLLAKVIVDCCENPIVKSSSRGPAVLELLDGLKNNFGTEKHKELSDKLMQCMMQCISRPAGKKKMSLPQVWRNFHVARLSPGILSMWQSYLNVLRVSKSALSVSDLTLQLVLKQVMHTIVKQLTSTPSESASTSPQPLTDREENVVRYMAGYVIVKLKKRYRKYASVLESMKTGFDDSSIETLQDYTRVWVEQRDRGGLCHVNDKMFSLIKRIEMVCRLFLDTRSPSITTDALKSKIEQKSLQSNDIIVLWDDMVRTIPAAERVNLLKLVIGIWTNIRVHSFAEGVTEIFQKSNKKSTRKTLKQLGTDKDSTMS